MTLAVLEQLFALADELVHGYSWAMAVQIRDTKHT
jgi:hypothetical protein